MSDLALLCQKRPLVSPFYARRVSHADHEQMEFLIMLYGQSEAVLSIPTKCKLECGGCLCTATYLTNGQAVGACVQITLNRADRDTHEWKMSHEISLLSPKVFSYQKTSPTQSFTSNSAIVNCRWKRVVHVSFRKRILNCSANHITLWIFAQKSFIWQLMQQGS